MEDITVHGNEAMYLKTGWAAQIDDDRFACTGSSVGEYTNVLVCELFDSLQEAKLQASYWPGYYVKRYPRFFFVTRNVKTVECVPEKKVQE